LADNSITIIIPAYNQNEKIQNAVHSTIKILVNITSDYELIIAEDGSCDGTYETAVKLKDKDPRIFLMHSDQRSGKGLALKKAIKAARGMVIGFIDADLATDMSHLPALIDAIRIEGYDVAIGSRFEHRSKAQRSMRRSFASIAYNQIVRLMLDSKIKDHQCGFKAFNRYCILSLLDQIKDERWFWDTEMLVRAQQEGYKIKEMPVNWRETDATAFNFVKDSWDMGWAIIKLRWDLTKDR
jgi:glycosyltransferase AglD